MTHYSIKRVAVYCASSSDIAPVYFNEADRLGELMAQQNWALVYGGGGTGLMGRLATSLQKHGGKTIGITPEVLKIDALLNHLDDERILTPDMPARKTKMIELADAFMALPGGFGTLEELFEVITLKILGVHQKPIIIINFDGYYDQLLGFFENIYQQKFARIECRKLYTVANTPEEAIDYLKTYQPPQLDKHWFV